MQTIQNYYYFTTNTAFKSKTFAENVVTQILPFAESKQHYKKLKKKNKQQPKQTKQKTNWKNACKLSSLPTRVCNSTSSCEKTLISQDNGV